MLLTSRPEFICSTWTARFSIRGTLDVSEEIASDPHILVNRVRLLDDGELLVLIFPYAIIHFDRNGKVLQRYRGKVHHDFDLTEKGKIYALTRKASVFPNYHPQKPILNDQVTIFAPDGQVEETISLLDAFERSDCCSHYLEGAMFGDVFHSNTLELLDGRLEHRHPAFKAGNLLTSWRNLNAIGIINPETKAVVWAMDGFFRRQHLPTILENGNILLFDNYDVRNHVLGWQVLRWAYKKVFKNPNSTFPPFSSRIIEFDPFTREIAWQYDFTDNQRFWAEFGGTSFVLPNGNVLITETPKGQVFEVTREGKIVWQFINPLRVADDSSKVQKIHEMQRLSPGADLSWLWLLDESKNPNAQVSVSE